MTAARDVSVRSHTGLQWQRLPRGTLLGEIDVVPLQTTVIRSAAASLAIEFYVHHGKQEEDNDLILEVIPHAAVASQPELAVMERSKWEQDMPSNDKVESVNFSPGRLDFGNIGIGDISNAQEVEFVNNTGNPVPFAEVAIRGNGRADYEETHEGASQIGHSDRLRVRVRFRPVARGLRVANLSIVFPDGRTAGPVELNGFAQ